jgi:hypothetical protein
MQSNVQEPVPALARSSFALHPNFQHVDTKLLCPLSPPGISLVSYILTSRFVQRFAFLQTIGQNYRDPGIVIAEVELLIRRKHPAWLTG